jgi:hypothetical protein
MSEPENFLSRWSRLKREAEPEPEPVAQTPADGGAPAAPADGARAELSESAVPAGEDAAFDLSQLPSIDSIGADTDISLFMRPGVPSALRHAALRRAWTSDPAIRDFRGLQENDWDFTAPDSVPGFGTFKSEDEVKALAQRLFGPDRADDARAVAQSAPEDRPDPRPEERTTETVMPAGGDQAEPPPPVSNGADAAPAALQQADRGPTQHVASRRHGSALPQ